MKKIGSYVIKKFSNCGLELSFDDPTPAFIHVIYKNNEWVCECFDFDTARQIVYGLILFDDFSQFIGSKLQDHFEKRNEDNK